MRIVVVAAGILGGLGVVGLAMANIPTQKLESKPPLIAEISQPTVATHPATQPTPEVHRIKKRKPKAKTSAGATGAKLALPKQCASGAPNSAGKPYC